MLFETIMEKRETASTKKESSQQKTYRICHELTVEINESWKMLLTEPLASLITFSGRV